MNPWTIIASAGGALVMSIAAFFFGVSYEGNRIHAQQLADLKVEQAQAAKTQSAIGAASLHQGEDDAVRGERVRETYREVAKIVDRPVYRNVCLDADGLRVLVQATAIANGDYRPAPAGGAAPVQPAAGGGGQGGAGLGDRDARHWRDDPQTAP